MKSDIDPTLATDVMDILSEHYYSIGSESGHEALAVIMVEFQQGLFDPNLLEWEITRSQFREIVFMLAERWNKDGSLWVSPLDPREATIHLIED